MATTATGHANRPNTAPNWLRSPQRVWLRRAIFQVHLWIGVVLALYCVLIGLSGAALVFKEQIEQYEAPIISHGTQRVTLQQAIGSIQAARPGWRVNGLKQFDQHDHATVALMGEIGGPPSSNYRVVLFDPNTGAVLRDGMRFDGVLGWLANLHINLLSGRVGLLVNGWMCLGLLLLCISGLIVWWPGQRRALQALTFRLHHGSYRKRLNLKRLNWNLHSFVGFWSCAALLAVSWTGLYFCFPDPVRNVTSLLISGSMHLSRAQDVAPQPKSMANHSPAMTVDEAVAAARRSLPAEAPAGYMSLPLKPDLPFLVTGYYREALPYSRLVSLTLDPHDGAVLSRSDTTQEQRSMRLLQYSFTLHFGSFGGRGSLGIFVRIVWVLVGVAPALLAVTGLLMWWNRELLPGARRRRRNSAWLV